MCGIGVWDRVWHRPNDCQFGSSFDRTEPVIGNVIYVHNSHAWFLVEYNGVRNGYKFADIGVSVKPVGRKRR